MNALSDFGIIPIDYGVLRNLFIHYKFPKDKIASLEKKGEIFRIKKGLYIVSPELTRKKICLELLANHLYGPSYVSNVWALNYYGIIPERVQTITSVTIKRSRSFNAKIGHFEYFHVPEEYFSIGIKQKSVDDEYAYLIAEPEKALCDLMYSTNRLRLQSVKAVKEYLEDDLRCDFSGIANFNTKIVKNCIDTGVSKTEFANLVKYMESWNEQNKIV